MEHVAVRRDVDGFDCHVVPWRLYGVVVLFW